MNQKTNNVIEITANLAVVVIIITAIVGAYGF